jgi:hypothetical protein
MLAEGPLRQAVANVTPIRRASRHTLRQWTRAPFADITNVNRSGMPNELGASSAAPASDKLRTMQLKAPPGNSISPPFKTRLRCAARFLHDV